MHLKSRMHLKRILDWVSCASGDWPPQSGPHPFVHSGTQDGIHVLEGLLCPWNLCVPEQNQFWGAHAWQGHLSLEGQPGIWVGRWDASGPAWPVLQRG